MPKILKFVRLKASSDRAKTHIEKALLGAKAAGIDTELIKEEEIVKEYAEVDADHDKPKLELETVYVCDPFEGEHFELLKKRKIRIVGPQCILSCLNTMKPLPKVSDPIHNLTMLDVVACCTNVPKSERQKLQTHITMMGGKFVGDFTSAVTHLIAGEVGSKKYQVASNLGKIIVLPSWVYACWEQGAYEHKSAFDKEFSRYFCPCFKGFTICVTGLLAEERQQIKTLTTENGGTYSGELNMRTCTHLLVKYPRGEKYEYAKQWKIHCISTRWFYDCIRAGYWLQESPYKLEPGDNPRSSELNMSRSRVDMTAQSDLDISVASLKAAQVAAKVKKGREVQQNTKASIETKPDNKIKNIEEPTLKIRSVKENFTLDKISFRNSALFLDGCKIFLCGSSTKSNDILRRLINSGGGMRFNQMSDDITHVVIVDSITREVERFLQKSEHLPHIVSVHWLVDSFKAGICLREEDYSLLENEDENHTESKSVHVEDNKEGEKPKDGNLAKNKEVPSFRIDFEEEQADEDDVFNQYLPKANNKGILPMDDTKEEKENTSNEQHKAVEDVSIQKKGEDAIAELDASEDADDSTLLSKFTFNISCFEDDHKNEIHSLIEEYGGRIVGSHSDCDYKIAPLIYETKRKVAENEVSICWLEQCLENETILDQGSSFLFRPFFLPPGTSPLEECVLSVSQFAGMERDHLLHLAELLGATVQEHFVRKASGNMKASTHLLLKEPDGNKYEAACRWDVPCVSKDWLFACAANRKLMPMDAYPLKRAEEDELEENTEEPAKNEEELAKDHEDGKDETELEHEVIEDPEIDAKKYEIPVQKAELKMRSSDKVSPDKEKVADAGDYEVPMEVFDDKDFVNIDDHQNQPQLNLTKSFRPSFDLSDAMEALNSPNSSFVQRRKSRASRGSFPLDNLFNENIQKAVKRTQPAGIDLLKETKKSKECVDRKETVTTEDNIDQKAMEEKPKKSGTSPEKGVLTGVVICVSKKLTHRQTELHNFVSSLGGDYRYMYNDSCTHLIHQGRQNDTTKEFTLAKKKGKFIVSPHWLDACLDEDCHVDEALYPHTYNPKMSLNVVTSAQRVTRSMSTSSTKDENKATDTEKFTLPAAVAEEPSTSEVDRKKKEIGYIQNDGKGTANTTTGEGDQAEERPENTNDEEVAKTDEDAGEELATVGRALPSIQQTSSLDARMEFQRQMEEIMEATKNTRGGLRKNRRQQTGSTSEEGSGKRSSTSRRLRPRQSSQKSSGESGRASNEDTKSSKNHGVEPSQGDFITYDDPVGREERARILAQLKAASPSQDVEREFEPIPPADSRCDADKENEDSKISIDRSNTFLKDLDLSKISDGKTPNVEPPSPSTPPPPPINLQISNPIPAPQPVNLLEEKKQLVPSETGKATAHRIMLSGMTPQEKIDYSALVEHLGGKVFDAQHFTPQCTHVVVGNPSRNEKFLASVAAGKWVLHKSYLEASREAGHFVGEEEHEWGREADSSKLASAARRWRLRLSQARKKNESAGAFIGWKVLLCVDHNRQAGFKRLLEAGGSKVVGVRPPYTNIDGVTHAFIDLSKSKPGTFDNLELNLKEMLKAGIWILRPDYIAEYLMQEPVPPASKFVIPEVHKLNEEDSETYENASNKKRKAEDVRPSQRSKRSRK